MLSPDAETELLCVRLDPVQIGTCTSIHWWEVLEAWNNPVTNAPWCHTGDNNLSWGRFESEGSATVTLKTHTNVASRIYTKYAHVLGSIYIVCVDIHATAILLWAH